jgi:uncharacterized membrane protein
MMLNLIPWGIVLVSACSGLVVGQASVSLFVFVAIIFLKDTYQANKLFEEEMKKNNKAEHDADKDTMQ